MLCYIKFTYHFLCYCRPTRRLPTYCNIRKFPYSTSDFFHAFPLSSLSLPHLLPVRLTLVLSMFVTRQSKDKAMEDICYKVLKLLIHGYNTIAQILLRFTFFVVCITTIYIMADLSRKLIGTFSLYAVLHKIQNKTSPQSMLGKSRNNRHL